MKKVFLLSFFFYSIISSLFAQNRNYEEFLYLNPFLKYNEFYIENTDVLKGMILKTISKDYDLNSDGTISYGDAEGSSNVIKYYYFNDNCILLSKYMYVFQGDKLISRKKWIYNYYENGCDILYCDLESKKNLIEKYSLTKISNTKIFTKNEDDINYELHIDFGKRVEIEQKYDWEQAIKEENLKNDICVETWKTGDKIHRTIISQKGVEVSDTQEKYGENGKLIFKKLFDVPFSNGRCVTQVLENEKLTKEISTGNFILDYSDNGYLKSVEIFPSNKKEGRYHYYYTEILTSEDDDFFKNNKN